MSTPNNQIIRLNSLKFFAYHGLTAQEQKAGGRFEVDCEYETKVPVIEDSSTTKNIIDYELIYDQIADIITNSRFNLLEALAEKTVDSLMKMFNLKRVKVRIRKINPPVSGEVESFEVISERKA